MKPKPPTPKKPRTGVTRYDPEFAARICERIATTPRSLSVICQAPDMPGIATLFRWLGEHPDFREMYNIAKENQAEILIEEALEIVDDDSQDILDVIDGKPVFNRIRIQRCKMQVEHRRWIAAKLLPRKYGTHQRGNSTSSSGPKSQSTPHGASPASGGIILTPERMRNIAERRRRAMESSDSPVPPSTPPPGTSSSTASTPPAPLSPNTPSSAATTPYPPPTAPPSPESQLPSPDSSLRTPNSDLQSPIPDPRPPISAPWARPIPPRSPRSDHRPKPWYDFPTTPPPRQKTWQNKACA